jgi:hypothetical protein
MTQTALSFLERLRLAFSILFNRELATQIYSQLSLEKKSLSESESPSESEAKSPEEKPSISHIEETDPRSALQLLALLQQEARFLDFIHEDIQAFSDTDIGAAARVVHEGSRKVIQQHLSLQPVRSENEMSRITVPEGFDASRLRLTGKLLGQAPFTGTLIHCGWYAAEVRLPKLVAEHDCHVIAPAEVEL